MPTDHHTKRAFGAGAPTGRSRRAGPKPADDRERVLQGSKVIVFDNDIKQASRRLDKILKKDGHGIALARMKFFSKPSEDRRRKQAAGTKVWRRAEAKMRAEGLIVAHRSLASAARDNKRKKGTGGRARRRK